MLHAWLSVLAGVSLIAAGAFGGIMVLMYLGWVGVVAWAALSVEAWVELRRMNAAITRVLGLPISFFGGPPSRQDRFQAWCRSHNVEPYPFRGAQPPVARTHWF
jgi:hypothetical protein